MNRIILAIAAIALYSCSPKTQSVDLIISNAKIYTVDTEFSSAESFAVKDGKFVAVGTNEQITSAYQGKIIDLKGAPVFPGLIDAHCHFYGMGQFEQTVRFEGATSFKEVVQRLVSFQEQNQLSFITGRGWDQNDWEIKKFPTKDTLDLLFPRTPIAITRVDGHALLVNQAALDLTTLSDETKIAGGEIMLDTQGKMTGVLIDAAMDPIYNAIPEASRNEQIQILKTAQEICFSYGLTTVDDAGLSRHTIELIDSLNQTKDLQIRMYAMISADDANLDYYLNKGISKTPLLNIRSFKFYGDGALGSRGATLRKPYSDRHEHYGALVNSVDRFKSTASRIANSEFQMNTHAIGDSTNHLVLETYAKVLMGQKNRRWRIEHAQIVSPEDFHYFKEIIPSIQPTHATSDMYWAEDRIGSERIKTAYAYQALLKENGRVALGTDFPVENVNPFYTFYAAVARKDLKSYPKNGFQKENGLSREQALRGMTIWAAYSNFEEAEKGSIEVGKYADFTVLDTDLMTAQESELPETKVQYTYVNGSLVYSQN